MNKAISVTLTIGAYILILYALIQWRKYVDYNGQCVITNITHRNCWERDAYIQMDQWLTVTKHSADICYTGYIHCGKVRKCLTSPCNYNVDIGNIYYCTGTVNKHGTIEYELSTIEPKLCVSILIFTIFYGVFGVAAAIFIVGLILDIKQSAKIVPTVKPETITG